MNVRTKSRLSLVALVLLGPASEALRAAEPSAASSTNKAWRQPAADRPRRIIFNNDGNDPITRIKRPSVEDMLAARSTALAGTQVDAIFYCTFGAGFGHFSHLTKVGQVFTARGERFEHNQMEAFATAGIDPLRVMIDFAHQHRMELFWSMRMNDTHDGSTTNGQGPVLFAFNRLKNEHPEFLLGNYREKPRHGSWSGVNYARAEIRELAFRYVEEVCRLYDVDGVELDFFRHPIFFRTTTRGEPATAGERAGMTELLRRIRTMADEVGRARRRPILIAARVPDAVDYARAIGLEIDRWMADDLIDLLIPAGYFQLNDWTYSVELARRHGVKVYPSLDETRITHEAAARLRMTDLGYRGRAAEAWAAGADGVYLFNFFDPRSPRWRELGDPRALSAMDKDYFASFRGVGAAAGGNLPHASFQSIETLNPTRPKPIAPGKTATAGLNIGDETSARAAPPAMKLRLQFAALPPPGALDVQVNGRALPAGAAADGWLEIALAPAALHPGRNEIAVTLAPSAKAAVRWTDLHLQVRDAVRR